jgi:ABC-type sugar transport system substrate-binding protein
MKMKGWGGDFVKKNFVKRLLVTVLVFVLVFSLAACGGTGKQADQPTPDEGDKPAAPAEKRTYAIIYPVIHQFFDPVTREQKPMRKELGNIELFIHAPEGGQVQQQIEIMLKTLYPCRLTGLQSDPPIPRL